MVEVCCCAIRVDVDEDADADAAAVVDTDDETTFEEVVDAETETILAMFSALTDICFAGGLRPESNMAMVGESDAPPAAAVSLPGMFDADELLEAFPMSCGTAVAIVMALWITDSELRRELDCGLSGASSRAEFDAVTTWCC